MLDVILCDDDREFILHMERLIKEIAKNAEEPYKIIFREYYSGEELLAGISDVKNCDLLILDMQMPGMDGDETASRFREVFDDAVLVFCSGEMEPTTKSFKADAYRYLRKQGAYEDFMEDLKASLDKAVHKKAHSKVVIEDKQGIYVIKISDIMYVEIADRGCEIHLNTKSDKKRDSIKINKKMTEMQKLLKDYRFASPHKSYYVNLEYVFSVDNTQLTLMSGAIISISKYKAKEFKQAYLKYATKD